MIHKVLKGLAPVAALAASAMLAGCNVDMQIGDTEGVPLAELDMSGAEPTEIVLASPDNVIITTGDTFNISVSGNEEAADLMRFNLEDNALGIMREKSSKSTGGPAIVNVTMPTLEGIVLAGSGTIEADRMDGRAEVTIAGSGSTKVTDMRADKLDLTIAGSGDFETAGEVGDLEMTVAGSGSGKMAGLKVGKADITVAGSGDAEFQSDGDVEANIVGSGDITVSGNATCTVSSLGSGKLRCKAGTTARSDKPSAPEAPEAPEAPKAPEAPGA
ncbi:MAG: DUF2807 domain-containing protein [Erythrobacter sp.]|nr:DUF2807 domain-containing protein [Erythrobacter sp.]